MVLHFIFRSMIHFELVFVKGIMSVSKSIVLNEDVQFFQHHLLKSLPFFHYITFAKDQLTIFMQAYFWALYSFPLIYLSILSPKPHCLGYCSLIVSLEVG